ncbi:MAG: hypothetical protein LBS10_06350 [Gracilibacteraceae bacterium]|jgi:hypothetical protein|nr:hypothetical protein [Gracilibacteraceae bacterium]
MRITIAAEPKEIADIADKLRSRQQLSNDMLADLFLAANLRAFEKTTIRDTGVATPDCVR